MARELRVCAVGKVLVPVWVCPHPAQAAVPQQVVFPLERDDTSSMTLSLLLGYVGVYWSSWCQGTSRPKTIIFKILIP